MRRHHYALIVILLMAGSFLAGYRSKNGTGTPSTSATGHRILYYHDPMHPSYKSDRPGIAPDCGMNLEAVYSDDPATANPAQTPVLRNVMNISPEKQQLIGVRMDTVERESGAHTVRLLGRVAPDETRVYRVNVGIEGFIREVSPVTTGDRVQKGQLLAALSAPNALNVIQLYILNLGSMDRIKQNVSDRSVEGQSVGAGNSNIQQRLDQLKNLGMSALQIEEIARTRQVPESIKLLSPTSGFVLERNVSVEQKCERGAELYRIADLDRVWVVADVYESEAQYLRPGVVAQVSVQNQRKSFPATVSQVLPQYNPMSGTLKVRLEADNPGYALRPDMFVNVELPVALASTISVPADAVLDSGQKKTVFVHSGEGQFEPREVQTGWRHSDRVEIVSGLTPGEHIVVSGTFLIDSETRMKAASPPQVFSAGAGDPSCGMEVDENEARNAGRISVYQGKTYYFCSNNCKNDFDREPARFSKPRKSQMESG